MWAINNVYSELREERKDRLTANCSSQSRADETCPWARGGTCLYKVSSVKVSRHGCSSLSLYNAKKKKRKSNKHCGIKKWSSSLQPQAFHLVRCLQLILLLPTNSPVSFLPTEEFDVPEDKVVFAPENNSTFLECVPRSPQATVSWLLQRDDRKEEVNKK